MSFLFFFFPFFFVLKTFTSDPRLQSSTPWTHKSWLQCVCVCVCFFQILQKWPLQCFRGFFPWLWKISQKIENYPLIPKSKKISTLETQNFVFFFCSCFSKFYKIDSHNTSHGYSRVLKNSPKNLKIITSDPRPRSSIFWTHKSWFQLRLLFFKFFKNDHRNNSQGFS